MPLLLLHLVKQMMNSISCGICAWCVRNVWQRHLIMAQHMQLQGAMDRLTIAGVAVVLKAEHYERQCSFKTGCVNGSRSSPPEKAQRCYE